MKFIVFSTIVAIGCCVPGASASLRGPFEDQVAATLKGKDGHSDHSKSSKSKSSSKSEKPKKECRKECEDTYCPKDDSCYEKCKECCTPTFTCDDSDFPISGGGDRDQRCFLDDDDCNENLFCKVGDYSCSEESNPSGRCLPVTGDSAPCPFIMSPVCGCDGLTYNNKCVALAAGVNVAKDDACELPGNGGEVCYLNDDTCTSGLFCRVGNYACGEEDNPDGRCAPEPKMCSYELHEVCGCDGQTYSNPCSAYAAGVNIEKNEPCPTKSNLGEQCFFDDQASCGNGLFCKIHDYYCKYEGNPEGECRNKPEDTVCTYQSEPVCGCDCNTYGNSCQAHAAGVNIYANSACPGNGCDYPRELALP